MGDSGGIGFLPDESVGHSQFHAVGNLSIQWMRKCILRRDVQTQPGQKLANGFPGRGDLHDLSAVIHADIQSPVNGNGCAVGDGIGVQFIQFHTGSLQNLGGVCGECGICNGPLSVSDDIGLCKCGGGQKQQTAKGSKQKGEQPKRHAPAGMTTGFCHGWYLLKEYITKSNKMEICHYYNILTQKVKLINIKQEIIQLSTRKSELIM